MRYISNMKNTLYSFGMALLLSGLGSSAWAQSGDIQPNFLNVHITENSTRQDLAQLQKDMSQVGIGFRYDLVDWVDGKLQSIRFAVLLNDGTMRRTVVESLDADSDIWIRLEGSGEGRIFCAGSNCED